MPSRLPSPWSAAVRLALLGYAVFVAVHQEQVRPNYGDFDQLYLGGVVAAAGRWELLYPIPRPHAERNAGLAADPKPGTAALWRERSDRPCPNFIYPPTAALLLAPLAAADRPTAAVAWQVLGGAAVWGIGLLVGRVYRAAAGRRGASWAELGLHAGLVLAPRSVLELNHGNVSQVIGLLTAAAVLAALARRPGAGAALVLLAAGLKVSPACLLAVFVARPFRPSWRAAGGLAAAAGGVVLVTGPGVWAEYVREVAPTLARTWLPDYPGDLATASVHGVVGLLLPGERLTPGWEVGIRAATVLTLAALLAGYLRAPGRLAADPYRLIGFAAGLIAWSLFFSPILWYQYWYYYLFAVPWLLAALRPVGGRAVLAALALFLMFGPWGRVPPFSGSDYAARMVPGWICLTLLVLSLFDAWRPAPRATDGATA